jgi:NAD(P)-dependent dehydrogenase (short-subunit alcohol dehydrogenase family)
VRGLLDGKVAIVAGIGPGLGREIALLFAEHGASLALGARTVSRCEELAAEIGDHAMGVALDVTSTESCEAAVAATVERFGGVDIVVNNAFDDGDFRRIMDADLDAWQRTFDVNFFGAVRMTRAAVPAMRARGEGKVVMVNTMSTQRIQERFGVYAASKGALATATRTLALELGGDGIRVNGIHPGYIWGPNVEAYFAHQAQRRGVDPQVVYDEVASEVALGYLPPAAEIAGAALFFASDLSRSVTGQALGVNGGHIV